MNTFLLNHKELELILPELKTRLEGAYVDRVYVPLRPYFSQKFLKNEWAIDFKRGNSRQTLIFNLRAQRPYLYLAPANSQAKASLATQSVFGIQLSSDLSGRKLESITQFEQDRVLVFKWTRGSSSSHEVSDLVLFLSGTLPEAFLTDSEGIILYRTRSTQPAGVPLRTALPPTQIASSANSDPKIRISDLDSLGRIIQHELNTEALETRVRALDTTLTKLEKSAVKQVTEAERSIRESEQGGGRAHQWEQTARTIQAELHSLPKTPFHSTTLQLHDQKITVRPEMTPSQFVQYCFEQAKKSRTRLKEISGRLRDQSEFLATIQNKIKFIRTLPPEPTDAILKDLEALEASVQRSKKSGAAEIGLRSYRSKEGYPLLGGRNLKENQMITFKVARGNDLWFHLRGRPSAHVIVQLPPKKSASLETLLDAAQLLIHLSGYSNEGTGKMEVDYTFRKYVKRIKDSDLASYSQEKTLIISFDSARLKRILESLSIMANHKI